MVSFRQAQTTHHSKILSQNKQYQSQTQGPGPKVLLALQMGTYKLLRGCVDPETNQGSKGGIKQGEIR